jgi:RNA polymerase sigma factor (sigma-70 family)
LPLKDGHAQVEELVSQHSEHLRRFLRTRVRNTDDVPDLIQEIFLRLLRVPDFETIRAPEAYIFTIACHMARQHALRSAVSASFIELSDVLNEALIATDCDPALEAIAQQCVMQLDAALQELSPKIQFTFLSYRRDGLSLDEISARLGISRPMAKKYLAKALVHFRKRLKDTE